MRKAINIAFIAVAVMMMTVLSMVPHHHHRGLWCSTLSECFVLHTHTENDHDDCENHCGHQPDNANSHTSCVEDMRGIASKVKLVPPSDVQLTTAAILVSIVYQALAPQRDVARVKYFKRPVFYTSATLCRVNALRAPPACFV